MSLFVDTGIADNVNILVRMGVPVFNIHPEILLLKFVAFSNIDAIVVTALVVHDERSRLNVLAP